MSEASRLLFVTLADGTGSRLEVPFVLELPGWHWLPLPGAGPSAITPKRVAQLIEAARALGWRPEAPGPAFRFPKR